MSMDPSFYSLQCQWCSDSDLSSVSSPETLSPVHCMDSSLSPSYQQPLQSTPAQRQRGYSQSLKSSPCSPPRQGRRTGRARIRSKQRESASEKEKLRMRDLTKALHHLRSYLPPSVAPVGQTLTKIETLRLAIRYISNLSAQLGLSEEVLFQRRGRGDASASDPSSPEILHYFQNVPAGGQIQMQSQNLDPGLHSEQCCSQTAPLHPGECSFDVDQLRKPYTEVTQSNASVEMMLPSPPASQSSCQMCGKDFCTPLVRGEYWG